MVSAAVGMRLLHQGPVAGIQLLQRKLSTCRKAEDAAGRCEGLLRRVRLRLLALRFAAARLSAMLEGNGELPEVRKLVTELGAPVRFQFLPLTKLLDLHSERLPGRFRRALPERGEGPCQQMEACAKDGGEPVTCRKEAARDA